MIQDQSITARLENWGRWCNSNRGGKQADSMTAAVCRRLQDAELGNVYDRENGIDQGATPEDEDAMLLERAMRQLDAKPRLLLKLCFVEMARPEVICRMVGIPVRPASHFLDSYQESLRLFTVVLHCIEKLP